ncbi:MAG: hypothetical protein ACOCP4_06945 [Candidatus Woesearchaeota archaeon]
MRQQQKKLIMNRCQRLIKYNLISDEAANEINEIMLRELDRDMKEKEIDIDTLALQPEEEKINESHGYQRDVESECEGGACPVR